MLGVQVMARDPRAVQAAGEAFHHGRGPAQEDVGVGLERSGFGSDPRSGQPPAVAAESGVQMQFRVARGQTAEFAGERRVVAAGGAVEQVDAREPIAGSERARRMDVLQRAEHEFDPIPFDVDAARVYGRVTAAVIAAGRKPRRRALDLMIASIAIAEDLPLCTTNPDDFAGLEQLMTVVSVKRPFTAP